MALLLISITISSVFVGLGASYHYTPDPAFTPQPLGLELTANSTAPLYVGQTVMFQANMTVPTHNVNYRDWDFWVERTKTVPDYDVNSFYYSWYTDDSNNSVLTSEGLAANFTYTEITDIPCNVTLQVMIDNQILNSSSLTVLPASQPKTLQVSIANPKGYTPKLAPQETLQLSANITALNQWNNETLTVASPQCEYIYTLTPRDQVVMLVDGEQFTFEKETSYLFNSSNGGLTVAYASAFDVNVYISLQIHCIDENSTFYNQTAKGSIEISDPFTSPGFKFDGSVATAAVICRADGLGWFRAYDGLTGAKISALDSTNPDTTLDGALITYTGKTVYVDGGAWTGAALTVPASTTLIADPSTTGIKYTSIGANARIDEPAFNTCFGGYSGGSYTIVTGSSAMASGTANYLAMKPDSTISWSSTNHTSVEQSCITSATSINGTIILNQVQHDINLVVPANICIIETYNGKITVYGNTAYANGLYSTPSKSNVDYTRKSDAYLELYTTARYGFERTAEWTLPAQATIDYAERTQGNSSLDVLLSGATTVNIDKTVSLNLVNKTLAVDIKLDNSKLYSFVILLQSHNSWSHYYKVQLTAINNPSLAITNGTWATHFIDLPNAITSTSGNPSLSDITTIRIQIDCAAANTVHLNIDDFRIITASTSGYLTIRLDDGLLATYNMYKLMDARGLRGVEAVIPSGPKAIGSATRVNVTQLTEMQNSGWDIVSHSYTHPELATGYSNFMASMTIEQQNEELFKSQQWLVANGFAKGSRFFVAPGNTYDANLLSLIPQYYTASQISLRGPLYQCVPPVNPYTLSCRDTDEFNTAANLAIYKGIIDYAVTNNAWITFYAHNMINSTLFTEFLDYVVASGIKVVTFSDVFDNVVGNDGYKVTNTGYANTVTNGTWIPHGLPLTPNGKYELNIAGSKIINSTCYLLEPTLLASNSTHVQAEFLFWDGTTTQPVTASEARTIHYYFEYIPTT